MLPAAPQIQHSTLALPAVATGAVPRAWLVLSPTCRSCRSLEGQDPKLLLQRLRRKSLACLRHRAGSSSSFNGQRARRRPHVGDADACMGSSSFVAAAAAVAATVVAATCRWQRSHLARLSSSCSGPAVSSGALDFEEQPEQPCRLARAKGPQDLPLGHQLQRFFSPRHFWNYLTFPRNYFTRRRWCGRDRWQAAFVCFVHLGAVAAPFFFTWKAFACFAAGYVVTGLLGITLSYHRQLSHRSFETPKWLEYCLAYCGCLAVQGPPISWVASHRHHHRCTDTEEDVHSPLDGFWWSHMGWLMDAEGCKIRQNKQNASDLSSQAFYRYLQGSYALHAFFLPVLGLYAFGGVPCVLWGFFARVVWYWHITWSVNSVSHVWGFQDWKTGDLSMNNWLVGLLAFGEGWHNNHHAFERSCRHGLKWWQVDFTFYTVKLLEGLGLARNLQYPSESKMERLALASDGVTTWP